MPAPRVIQLPLVPTALIYNNDSVINDGLRSAIAPSNAPATDKFQCNVCQENCTKDPYVVPACLHSYCGDCISECLRMFGNECPACLVNGTTSKRTLRQDTKIDNNVSTYGVVIYCTAANSLHDQFGIRRHSRILLNESLQEIKKETEVTPLVPDLALRAQGLVRDDNNKRAGCDNSEDLNEDMACAVFPYAYRAVGARVGSKQYTKFEARFDELTEFKKKFGHCNVPTRYDANPTLLGNWCMTLKTSYKKMQRLQKQSGYLSYERIQRLEKLGFKWVVITSFRNAAFDQRVGELTEFKNKFGHCNVPPKYDVNPSLRNWCMTMRKAYNKIRKGESTRTILSHERIERLDKLGIKWKNSCYTNESTKEHEGNQAHNTK